MQQFYCTKKTFGLSYILNKFRLLDHLGSLGVKPILLKNNKKTVMSV